MFDTNILQNHSAVEVNPCQCSYYGGPAFRHYGSYRLDKKCIISPQFYSVWLTSTETASFALYKVYVTPIRL